MHFWVQFLEIEILHKDLIEPKELMAKNAISAFSGIVAGPVVGF